MKKFMIIACLVLIACFVWGINLRNDSGEQVGIDTGTEEVEDASEPESIGINKNSESAVRYNPGRQNRSVRNYPEGRRYTTNHVWVQPEGDYCWVGITDYLQERLGDIVYVSVDGIDEYFDKNTVFATIESISEVCDLYMPLSGTILGVNNVLEDSPGMLNSNAHEYPIIMLKPDDSLEFEELLPANEYSDFIDSW